MTTKLNVDSQRFKQRITLNSKSARNLIATEVGNGKSQSAFGGADRIRPGFRKRRSDVILKSRLPETSLGSERRRAGELDDVE
jgi:hypothetical protein